MGSKTTCWVFFRRWTMIFPLNLFPLFYSKRFFTQTFRVLDRGRSQSSMIINSFIRPIHNTPKLCEITFFLWVSYASPCFSFTFIIKKNSSLNESRPILGRARSFWLNYKKSWEREEEKKCRSKQSRPGRGKKTRSKRARRNEEMKFHCENRLTEISDRFLVLHRRKKSPARERVRFWVDFLECESIFIQLKKLFFAQLTRAQNESFFHLLISSYTLHLHTKREKKFTLSNSKRSMDSLNGGKTSLDSYRASSRRDQAI